MKKDPTAEGLVKIQSTLAKKNTTKPDLKMGRQGMELNVGGDQVKFGPEGLSIKAGDTSFSLKTLSGGLKMQASQKTAKGKQTSVFESAGGKVTRTEKGPGLFSKTVSRDTHTAGLAAKHADRIKGAGGGLSDMGTGPTFRSNGSRSPKFDDSIFDDDKHRVESHRKLSSKNEE